MQIFVPLSFPLLLPLALKQLSNPTHFSFTVSPISLPSFLCSWTTPDVHVKVLGGAQENNFSILHIFSLLFSLFSTLSARSFNHLLIQIIFIELLLCVSHWFRSWGYIVKDGTFQNDKELTYNCNTE